jgi:hypothetical protein
MNAQTVQQWRCGSLLRIVAELGTPRVLPIKEIMPTEPIIIIMGGSFLACLFFWLA